MQSINETKMNLIKLYGTPRSRASRVLWCLEEIGVAYENLDLKDVSDTEKENILGKVNPNLKVPALDDNGFMIFESMAINLHLAKNYSQTLWPTDSNQQSAAIQWSIWAMTEIEPPFVELFLQRIILPEEKRDPQAEETAIETINRPIGVLENILSKNDYVLGNTFTIADLNLVSIFTLNDIVKITMENFTRTEGWIEKCKSRPAYKKMASLR